MNAPRFQVFADTFEGSMQGVFNCLDGKSQLMGDLRNFQSLLPAQEKDLMRLWGELFYCLLYQFCCFFKRENSFCGIIGMRVFRVSEVLFCPFPDINFPEQGKRLVVDQPE